jgi:hypothetical protein
VLSSTFGTCTFYYLLFIIYYLLFIVNC